MTALVLAILAASVLGSLHCAGMCGAFLALAVAGPDAPRPSWASHATLQSAYHLGRLVTYAILGALAGALGSVVDLGGSMVGLQRIAALLAAVTIIGFGVVTLLRVSGARLPRLPLPPALQRLSLSGHRRAMNLPPLARAGAIGLLTTLLPCGWLYAFVVTAAGAGSAAAGALAMAAFWVGTLPVMVSLGAGLKAATGRFGARIPAFTAAALIVVGVLSIAGRLPMIGRLSPASVGESVHLTPAAAVDRVPTSSEGLPCCSSPAP